MEQLDPNSKGTEKLASYLYIVHPKLQEYLEKLEQDLQIANPNLQERGKLLEKIVFLVFKGLKGVTRFKSFQSASSQYDLLVSGDGEKWMTVCKILYLEFDKRDIVIEAKAKQSKVTDQDFARLCNIMELNLTNSSLGIFFTLEGATGFPKENDSRQRSIRDCRLRQALFHAKTGKYVIVLDKNDIFSLGENGTFIRLLTRKIRDLQELSGIPIVPVESWQEIDLPQHLKELEIE